MFGPHYAAKGSELEKLSHSYPGEDQALSGDMNPNQTYSNAQGKTLDFRKTTVPDTHGLVNLEQSLEAFSPDMVRLRRSPGRREGRQAGAAPPRF